MKNATRPGAVCPTPRAPVIPAGPPNPFRADTVPSVETGAHECHYISTLADWEESASVRRAPRRVPCPEEVGTRDFFPLEQVPIAQHPIVRNLGPDAVRYLQVQRLYAYQASTARLERAVVNPVVLRIAEGRLGLPVSRTMRRDADKIYTDEARHAQFAYDLTDLVEAATGIEPVVVGEPRFLTQLRRQLDRTPVAYQPLVPLCYTIVSETLISATLAKIPRDTRVVTAVREQVADHARDEGHHHRYFVQVMHGVWPALSGAERALLGPLLADFIDWFLEPDLSSMQTALSQLGLEPETANQILHESYPPTQRAADMREAAARTLRLFEQTGVFDDTRTYEAFVGKGLLG